MSTGTLDRDRLARILGLLGSTHDGEVIAAARAAERIRIEANTTWNEVLAPLPTSNNRGSDDDDLIWSCLAHCDLLTDWEQNFLWSIRRQRYPMSGKQLEVLRRIARKTAAGGRVV